MSDFESKLSALCSAEMRAARGDKERLSSMIERLSHSLAFTIAMTAEGNQKVASELLAAAELYINEAAGMHQKLGAFMAKIRGARNDV